MQGFDPFLSNPVNMLHVVSSAYSVQRDCNAIAKLHTRVGIDLSLRKVKANRLKTVCTLYVYRCLE